ncbi:NUDIX hydrolase [Dyella japonica]|uniref:NUDIX hydrolase n=2 Tax=Dyella japonica TaxID=231455 RepID=A0A075K293_9GAMM|nr:NUDIX hydrolase [Dyella japonica]AIF48441.1 NUDIX hydrolase [Dyella japonica A8]
MSSVTALRQQFIDYARQWPGEPDVTHFVEMLDEGAHGFVRENHEGHFTGSAWLVSADGERVLLTHHRKLGRWLQLGGHADGDADLSRVALREAEEESGLSGLSVEPGLFDLDRHRIPARGQEPEHWHYDVRYVVRAGASEVFEVSEESHALAWRSIREIAADPSSDESLRRMAGKWLHRS